MPKARLTSVNDMTAGMNIRCSDSELPNGFTGSDAAVTPVDAMFPMNTGLASANSMF